MIGGLLYQLSALRIWTRLLFLVLLLFTIFISTVTSSFFVFTSYMHVNVCPIHSHRSTTPVSFINQSQFRIAFSFSRLYSFCPMTDRPFLVRSNSGTTVLAAVTDLIEHIYEVSKHSYSPVLPQPLSNITKSLPHTLLFS